MILGSFSPPPRCSSCQPIGACSKVRTFRRFLPLEHPIWGTLLGTFCIYMFTPHPNLADDVNRAIIQSEIEGGVFLHDLPPSTVLEIQTMHHVYTAVLLGGSDALISGHPEFCPYPVQVAIAGSTWGGSMLKLQYVGRGMHLEFRHPEYATPIVTSPIQEIRDSLPARATLAQVTHSATNSPTH
jgi:hypothetical protein